MALLSKSKPKAIADLSEKELEARITRATKAGDRMLADRDALVRSGVEAVKARGAELKELRGAAAESEAELARRATQREWDDKRREVSLRGGGSTAGRALREVAAFGHSELGGHVEFDAGRLSEKEGKDLAALVRCRLDHEELSDAERTRHEKLVGKAAGDERLFEKARAAAEDEAKLKAAVEDMHVSFLDRRPLAPPGSVGLTREVFGWLRASDDGSFGLAHVGLLAILLLSFENEDASLFRTSVGKVRVERIDGEPFLVAGAELQDLALTPGVQGSIGSGQVGLAFDSLRLNGLITVTRADGALRIGRGPLAKSLREGP